MSCPDALRFFMEYAAREENGSPRSEEVRFAMDSPLEGEGFEPSVPGH
jgi:hypothetical protein